MVAIVQGIALHAGDAIKTLKELNLFKVLISLALNYPFILKQIIPASIRTTPMIFVESKVSLSV